MPSILFTRENASEMARRANIVRWSRPKPGILKPENNPQFPDSLPNPIAREQVESTRAQLAAIDRRLANADHMNVETLDLLTRAKERLWKVLAHAGGIAAPAHFKPERKSKREATMIDLAPEPLAIMQDASAIEASSSLTPSIDNAEKSKAPEGPEKEAP